MIPDSHVDIFEKESFAHVATNNPDGSPHVTPVWVGHEGRDTVVINTTQHRRKARNLQRDPQVALSVQDPDEPYRYVQVQGEVEEITREGAVEHINAFAQQYMGVEEYPDLDEENDPRVIVRIAVEHTTTMG
ncbi:MAG: PPOX class F420-dependent oxidoreductase [Haloferacaceae archaeon]